MAASDFKVGIPLYPGFDSLDVLGPFQTFTFAGMDRYLIAETCDHVKSWEGVLIKPRTTFDDCPQP
jgi:putative intracellular protease/amidase